MSKPTRDPFEMPMPTLSKAENNDIYTLCAIYKGHVAAAEAVLGILNQPRHKGISILHRWCEFHEFSLETVARRLRTLSPKDEDEAEDRANSLIDFELRRGASLGDVAALTSSLAAASMPASA